LNCEKENDFEQETQIIDNSIPLETVSIDEAKNTLNSLILKSKSTANKSDENLVIVDPDWSTIKQDSMKYSDALLTHVKATFKNSNNNKTADILFIKVDEDVISVLYSTFPMHDDKEILYITELNGDFIDSYIVEDGLLIKRLFFTKEENSSQKQAKTQQRMDYPLGCEDIMNIVGSLNDIFGFSVSYCSGGGGNGGSYNIYGNFGTMSFDGITITATGADQRRNNSNQDNINQDCERSNCDDDQDTRGGGSNTTRIRTEADRQREMAARISAQKKKCKDKGMLYVKGECVVDTESPCPIEGMTRNSEGKCERPCPDGFVRGNGPRCVEEDQIINELTDPCAKGIFTELENGIFEEHPLKPEVQVTVSNPLTLNFSESILKLFNDSANTHLTIQNGNAGISNAFTVGATITIGDNYLENATQLSIARTMIHESVHAYLNGIYYNYPDFENKTFKDKLHKYAQDKGYTDMNTFHHNFMGQYIDAMAYSLYEWDKTYGTGGNLGWEYYQSMVYSGMFQVDPSGNIATEIDTFKELVPNASDRQAIADIILNEQNGNNDANGTECD
jgi:hypothetical protein